MSDMISKQAAIEALNKVAVMQHDECWGRAVEAIAALPPAPDAHGGSLQKLQTTVCVEALVKAEWRGFDRSYLSPGIPCGYAIVGADDEGWQVSLSWRTCEETLDGTHATMDAARSAAEADLLGRLAAIRAGGAK